MAIARLYDTPAFAELIAIGERHEVSFTLCGAGATRLALMESARPDLFDRVDIVDLCPFMDPLELQVSRSKFDVAAVGLDIRANLSFAELVEFRISLPEAPSPLEQALPYLRVRIGDDGVVDPDGIIVEKPSRELQIDWQVAGTDDAMRQLIGARALTILLDYEELGQDVTFDSRGRKEINDAFFSVPLRARSLDVWRWILSAAGRAGRRFEHFLERHGVLAPFVPLFSPDIYAGGGVLSPNLSPGFGRTQIQMRPPRKIDWEKAVSAYCRPRDLYEPIASFPHFAIPHLAIEKGGEGDLIEMVIVFEEEFDLADQDVVAGLVVIDPTQSEDYALTLVPVVTLEGGLDPKCVTMRVSSAALAAAAAEFGALEFGVHILRYRPNARTPPELQAGYLGALVPVEREGVASAFTPTVMPDNAGMIPHFKTYNLPEEVRIQIERGLLSPEHIEKGLLSPGQIQHFLMITGKS